LSERNDYRVAKATRRADGVIEIEVFYIQQYTEMAQYARIWLECESCDKFEVINLTDLESHFFNGLVEGLRSDPVHFKIILTKVKTHPVDSSSTSFRRAGIKAAELLK
jgi:hypothetical protein